MAKTKFFNLDTDNTLGGANTSHYVVASQRAVKEYIDNNKGREIFYDYTGHHPILLQSNYSSPYTVYYSNDFALTEGVIFYMFFVRNNVASFQLNINSTGAKDVYMYFPSSADYSIGPVPANYIHAGDIATITYDNSRYYLLDVHRIGNDTNSLTCDTAAATATKSVINVPFVSLYPGLVVGVNFTNTNTASNPKLNINGLGAKSIYYNGAAITTNNLDKAGKAGVTTYYMYDGTYWVYMGENVDRVFVNTTTTPGSSFDAYIVPMLGTSMVNAIALNQSEYSDTLAADSGIIVVYNDSSTNLGNPYILLSNPLKLGIGGSSVTDDGDFIPIADSSEGNILAKGPEFDTSDTAMFLRHDGTWAPAGGGKSYTATNLTLTPSNDVATWTVTHNLGSNKCIASVRCNDATTTWCTGEGLVVGEEIKCKLIYTSNNVLTIKINTATAIQISSLSVVILGA